MPYPEPPPAPPPPLFPTRTRTASRRTAPAAAVLLAVAAGLHAAALLVAAPLQSANDRSRWATVWALVERDTFVIDAIDAIPAWGTIDKVQHEGHLYSSKPALLPVIAASIYRGLRDATGLSLYAQPATVTRSVLAVLNLVPFLLALAALAGLLRRHARTGFARRYTLAAAAFGTYLSPYLATFNNHTVAATSLLLALCFTVRILDGSRRLLDYALCGLTAAFVAANELPAAAFGAALFGLLLWKADRRRTLLVFVPAALLPIAAFVATTYWQTGGLKPFYTAYGTEKYIYIRDGLPSYWAEPHGLDRNLDRPAVYLFHCVLGHHGILSLSPIFLLTLLGWLRPGRASATLRPLLALGAGLTLLILGFYLTRTENYNYGGNTAGLRWAFWLIPFWLLALPAAIDPHAEQPWFRGLACGLLAVSVFSAWSVADNPWRPSWLFRLLDDARLIDYRDPTPPLPRPMGVWFPALPPAGADPAAEWVELTAPTADGSETLRLALIDAGKDTVTLRLTRTNRPEVTATISREPFETGADPDEFVVGGTPDRDAAVLALRQCPLGTVYRPGAIRHERTPARPLAFRTQHAAATADRSGLGNRIERRRVDAWLSDEVPFGVVRLRTSVGDPLTGETRSARDYVLTTAGRIEPAAWAAAFPKFP